MSAPLLYLVFRIIITLKSGSKYGEVSASPVIGEGEIVGLVAVARDVTERRKAEEELKKLTADLEFRVEERTRQLEATNRELPWTSSKGLASDWPW